MILQNKLLINTALICHVFHTGIIIKQSHGFIHTIIPTLYSRPTRYQTNYLAQNYDDNDFYDENIDVNSLGDWRTFRRNLAETGLPSKSSSSTLTTELDLESLTEEKEESQSYPTPRPKSVSKKNEEILKDQNNQLAYEYLTGVWAHTTPKPEVGGLMCRLPLEAEIYRLGDRHVVGKKLQQRLKLSTNFDDNNGSMKSNAPYPVQRMDGTTAGFNTNSDSLSFSPLAAKTVHWYRGAQRLIKSELKKVSDNAKNGRIDFGLLPPDSMEFVNMYVDNDETWQEVKLVLSNDEEINTVTTLTINRPLSSKLSESLGKLLLFGSSISGELSLQQTELLVRFLIAFETKCFVYGGGSECRDEPAIMVHGIHDLEGSREIAPGTRIYVGGVEAAIQGVMRGKYRAEEFRFFVGKDIFLDGEIDRQVFWGKYQPVACARSLALKQCIALPKPLWNEVFELCGGELKELSALELMKRNDIDTSETESMEDDNETDENVGFE